MGAFNGTIDTKYLYVYQNGSWLISQEDWDFRIFNIPFSQADTTLPSRQITGPPLPQRYSESPFKNQAYYYDDLVATIPVMGHLATLPMALHLRKRR